MTIVEKLKLSLEMLGGVATLNDIYKVFKKIDKDSIKTPQSSIRARIYENCKTLDAYNGEDLFRSIYGRGEGVFSLTNYFHNDEDAKFIYELKRERIDIWEKLKRKKSRNSEVIVSNKLIKKLKIHKGERGIYRDVTNTRKSIFNNGLALSVLNTGKIYDDLLTDSHLEYHYPTTTQKTTDQGEINSLKEAEKYNLPIFIVLGVNTEASKKELQLGYIKNHNDQQKTILIEFDYNKELILTPKYDSYIDTYINEDDLPLFQKRKKKSISAKSRANNQPKFRADVFNYYQNECAVCGINLFLDAAHIIPVENYGTDNKENGLILCKNHHKAFDDGFFKINPNNLKIEIIKEDKNVLNITRDNLNHLINKPGKMYLEWRYKKYKK